MRRARMTCVALDIATCALARIILTQEDDWLVAKNEEIGVASWDPTPEDALDNLDEAAALHKGEIGRPVSDKDLEEWGVDPDDVPNEPQVPDVPWFEGSL